MVTKKLGSQTAALSNPPSIAGFANVVGKKEGEGPLADFFDYVAPDDSFGESTWEKSESTMQKHAMNLAMQKAGVSASEVDWLFAGDLLNQCIGSSFAARDQSIPFFGLYGACSTMGEGLVLAGSLLDGGFGTCAGVVVSSHFCSAERQYRMPLEYGGQRTPTAQWTVTGAGAVILKQEGSGPYLTHVTVGKVVDLGIKDPNNMGAAMAPAAYDTLSAFFRDTQTKPRDYDRIFTGDLGEVGCAVVQDFFQRDGIDLSQNYEDCGLLLYDRKRQDMHAGGSGCGCSASVLNGYIFSQMRQGAWKKVVFAPTGALLSPTSSFQGESVPGICHAVCISAE